MAELGPAPGNGLPSVAPSLTIVHALRQSFEEKKAAKPHPAGSAPVKKPAPIKHGIRFERPASDGGDDPY